MLMMKMQTPSVKIQQQQQQQALIPNFLGRLWIFNRLIRLDHVQTHSIKIFCQNFSCLHT